MSQNHVVGTVVSVRAFPVKSMDAGPLARADVLSSGVRHDRGWAVIDESGDVVTARTADVLRTVRADVTHDGPAITLPGAEPVTGAAADTALSELVGRPVHVQPSAATGHGFNEVSPLHLVSRQAIERGADHRADHDDHGEQCPCSVEEPRANLVLDLAGDQLETGWVGARLHIGDAVLQVSKAPRHCLGVYADVVTEGAVAEGDEVVLARD